MRFRFMVPLLTACLASAGANQTCIPVSFASPDYPRAAMLARIEGTVRVRTEIAASGSVKVTEVVSGHPVLAQHVVNQIQTWHFRCFPSENHDQKQEMSWTFKLVGNCEMHGVCRQSVQFSFPSNVLVTSELPFINPGK